MNKSVAPTNVSKDEALRITTEKLLEVSKEVVPPGGSSGDSNNARYGGVLQDGTLKVYAYPCHRYVDQMVKPLTFYSRYTKRPKVTKRINREYFDFITGKDSPWKSFRGRNISHGLVDGKPVMTQDMDEIFQTGWCWSDLDHPVNLQHSFLVASRMQAEWPEEIKRWHHWVVQLGDVKYQALAFAFIQLFKKLDIRDKHWMISRADQYDWPLDPCRSGEDYIKNFCQGRIVGPVLENFSKQCSYKPVNTLFGKQSTAGEVVYPQILFNLYSKDIGFKEGYCKDFWLGRDSLSYFSYENNWMVTEDDILEIIKREFTRLEISNSDENKGQLSGTKDSKRPITG